MEPEPDAPDVRAALHAGRRLLVESARPAFVRDHPRATALALGTVCIGAFMGQLDASIVNLAYPALRTDFGAGIAAVQWVGLSYLLVLVSGVTAFGRLADTVGHKLLYVYGFLVFAAGSALCAAAPGLVVLDVCRALQAVGAAMMQANSVAIVTRVVGRDRLGRAIGLQGAAQALGLGLGPAAGGLLVAAGGWRLVFLVNVPVGLVGAGLGWYLLPRSRYLAAPAGFDWPGLAWFVAGVSTVLLALSLGSAGDVPAAVPVALGAVAAACGAGFVRHLRRTARPLVDPALLARRSFSLGIGTGLLSYLVLFGTLFTVPFLLEHGLGQGAARAGLELAALSLALGLVAPIAGRFADRRGPRLPTALGMGTAVLALVALAIRHDDVAVVVAELAVLGAGLGTFIPANNSSVMGAAPRTQSGLAAGVLNTTRGLGTALGLALGGLVFGLASGSGSGPRSAGSGTATVAILLAAVAGSAALLSARRPRA